MSVQLSYSTAKMLQGCSQKFHYYKVQNLPFDPDFEQESGAFNLGKAFHFVLEKSMHTKEGLQELLDLACKDYSVEEDKELIHAMLLRYLACHSKSDLSVYKTEFELQDDTFIGYVDALLVDSSYMKEKGQMLPDVDTPWWIADLKTASTISNPTLARLHNDFQLNLYASYADKIAEFYGLGAKSFQGVRYRVTTKSKAARRSDESYNAFVARLFKSVKSYDVIVRKDRLDPVGAKAKHRTLFEFSTKLRDGTEAPCKNYSVCDEYFRPCQFWSRCHGALYSESTIEAIKSEN